MMAAFSRFFGDFATLRPVSRAAGRAVETLERRVLFAVFGTPDTDFGVDGSAISSASGSTSGVEDMIVLSDGRILAAGDAGIVRFAADGEPDDAFGTSGRAKFTGLNHRSIAIDSSGRTYALGTAAAGTVILRFTTAGKTDTSFGQSGSILVTSSKSFTPVSIAVDDNNKMLVAGTFKTDDGQGARVRVYRLNTNGSADTGFDSDGAVEFNLATGTFLTPVLRDRVTSMHVLSGGDIVVAGGGFAFAPESFDMDNGQYIPPVFGDVVHSVARLNSNGSLDSSFGSGGISRAVVVESDENDPDFYLRETIVGGSTIANDESAIFVAGRNTTQVTVTRFDDDGSVDFTAVANEPADLETPRDVIALSDGRAVVLASPEYDSVAINAVVLDDAGSFGNVITVSRTTFGTVCSAGAIADNGDLLVGDADVSTFNYEVTAVDVGAENDPRPDEFADARANDIASDQLGRLHLAYYDAATTTLKYARRDADGRWTDTQTLDANPFAGQYVAIDVNASNNPGIAYFDGNGGDLKLTTFDGTRWTFRTVESKGSVGLYPALDFDDSGRATMTYYKKSGGDLKFARLESTGRFSYETVDSANDVGRSSVLVASPKTRRYGIAYVDNTTGSVMWAGRKKGGVGWTIKTAATTTGGADFLSMAFGFYQEPAISYYDAAKADLKLAYFDAAQQKFLTKTLATAGAIGLYSQVTFPDYFGQPTIFAYNRSQNRVTRFSNTLAVTPATENIITDAGRHLSIDFSSQGRLTTSYFDAETGKLKVRSASPS
jgi:uncharacterized delta-60 repeat protein